MARFSRGLVVLGLVAALSGAAGTATASPSGKVVIADDDVTTAIQQTIQRSNDEQVQAVATRNVSVMADTLTDDRFQDLAKTIQDMLVNHVTGIALLNVDWGPIALGGDGSSATATTFETWRITSTAGTVDDAPFRNDYTLVLDNGGAWRIKSDVQVMATSSSDT